MQKTGFTEVSNATYASKSLRKAQSAHADAVVFCKADSAAASSTHRSAATPSGATPQRTPADAAEDALSLSSIALDGASGALEEHDAGSRMRTAHTQSGSCVDVAGMDLAHTHSHAASSATLGGTTARERVSMLASGTYLSPRRGLADTPLDESGQLVHSKQLRSQQLPAQHA